MDRNDIAAPPFRPRLTDIALALGLLTRFPVPTAFFPSGNTRPAAHAAWAYPIVGLGVSGLSLLAALAAFHLGLPAAMAALMAILGGITFTGALHEDGLADCADGFWGGWTRERRLEIMKDSQIGTYGVLALVIVLALKGAAFFALFGRAFWMEAIICSAIASRAAMVVVMHVLPNVRKQGLSEKTGRPPLAATLGAVVIGVGSLFVAMPPFAVPILLVAIGAAITVALIAKAKIGGQTGDVLGATQMVVDTAILLACVPLLAT